MKNSSEDSPQTPPAGAAATIADGAGAAAHAPDPDSQQQANPEAATPESTQEHMGDGAGIRGGYGDSSQTNGLEGKESEEPTSGQQ
ncbi:hypothetical protein KLP40_14090 [Hymenobacter sp. NST-14]|uniref:hypothetical protein n=1 Tax=Hymenobacter piscis TaxID=2839984 RepID=UPI001C0366F5|nr:hypothetical protein [Hymenobacter piscis]MBT9394298.1 hypothetical protein [Hymenobacter piscis]